MRDQMDDHSDASADQQFRFIDMSRFDRPPPLPPEQPPDRPSALGQPPLDRNSTPTRAVPPRPERTRITTDPPPAHVRGSAAASHTGATTVAADHRVAVSLDCDFVVADDPAVWPDAHGSTAALLDLPERDRLPALEVLTTSRRRLVVIVARAQEEPVRALVAGARSLFDARVAVVRIDHGPALRAAAALIGQLTTAPSPAARPVAEIIDRLPSLCQQLGHLVLLRSVHRVDHPAVGFAQHLFSYLPGRRLFVLQTTPQGGIARITRKGEFRPASAQFLPFRFDEAHGVTVGLLGPRPLPDGLLDRLGVDAVPTPMPVTVSPASSWPDDEATEVVLMPQNVAGWVRAQLPTPETWPCRWCAEPLAAPIRSCPFCADTLT